MSCDEKTALLTSQRTHQHIIVVPARKDYEPIFATADYSYGLTLEELLPYKDDPWWQSVRRLCFGCFWLTFMLTLLAACALAYSHIGSACHANIAITTTTLPLPSSPPPPLVLATNGTLLLAL